MEARAFPGAPLFETTLIDFAESVAGFDNAPFSNSDLRDQREVDTPPTAGSEQRSQLFYGVFGLAKDMLRSGCR